jgi:Holliday junction resolvasome RuvABC endonuclease subunit
MSWVWAIDPAVSRVAFAYADLDSDRIEVDTLTHKTDAREGERLGGLIAKVRWHAVLQRRHYRPHVVFVEQPSGHIRNLQLAYATGVIQAALYEALGVPVWTIPSSKWKKTALGYGNASKEQVAAWVTAQGWAADSQDEADAVAMAHAGRLMIQQSRWDTREAA